MSIEVARLLLSSIPGAVSVADTNGTYRIDFAGSSRAPTAAELLGVTKELRLIAINAECRSRLIARFGDAAEQVSRSLGVYGAAEQLAHLTGIGATIDASNVARNSVIGAADIAAVGAVTVAWPVI